MVIELPGAQVELPGEFDANDETDLAMRGRLSPVFVRLETGGRYELHFIDPDRLKQELVLGAEGGTPFYAKPGLVVIPEVTMAAVCSTVERLAAGAYFNFLRPDGHSDANGDE